MSARDGGQANRRQHERREHGHGPTVEGPGGRGPDRQTGEARAHGEQKVDYRRPILIMAAPQSTSHPSIFIILDLHNESIPVVPPFLPRPFTFGHGGRDGGRWVSCCCRSRRAARRRPARNRGSSPWRRRRPCHSRAAGFSCSARRNGPSCSRCRDSRGRSFPRRFTTRPTRTTRTSSCRSRGNGCFSTTAIRWRLIRPFPAASGGTRRPRGISIFSSRSRTIIPTSTATSATGRAGWSAAG